MNTTNPSKEPNWKRFVPPVAALVAIASLAWNIRINSQQIKLQAQQTQIAERQVELANQQANLKHIQDKHNHILNGISIHPMLYDVEIKVDELGHVLANQSFEIINGSERLATEITAFWEIIGTDNGNPIGWGGVETIALEKHTLIPLEQLPIKSLPTQLEFISDPKNASTAKEYYGYLRIVFSDSRLKKPIGNSYRVTIHYDKLKKTLVMRFNVDSDGTWLEHYLRSKDPRAKAFSTW